MKDLEKKLFEACGKGNIEEVESLIKKGADVNVYYKNGNTVLMVPSYYGYTEIVQLLIKEGANVNASLYNGDTALIRACRKNNIKIVKLLIDAGADVNANCRFSTSIDYHDCCTALMFASENGNIQIVKLLIDAGADVNDDGRLVKNLYHYENNNMTKIRQTALIKSVNKGCVEITKLLIESGADLEICTEYGYNALIYAAYRLWNMDRYMAWTLGYLVGITGCKEISTKKDYIEIIKLLIKSGANINFKETWMRFGNYDNYEIYRKIKVLENFIKGEFK